MPASEDFATLQFQPPPEAFERRFRGGDLPALRQDIASVAAGWSLTEATTADVVLVSNELASNSIRHGGGRGRIWVWREGRSVTIQVAGTGFLADPLASQKDPDDTAVFGRGLYLVRQLSERLLVRSLPGVLIVRARLGVDLLST